MHHYNLEPDHSFFIPFPPASGEFSLPETFAELTGSGPHPLCLLAAIDLQQYLATQNDWEHNFGLDQNKSAGRVIGKMFGVLAVQTADQQIGYIAAFSGKLAGSNRHRRFVPPVFDLLTGDGFLTNGMLALSAMNEEIKMLKEADTSEDAHAILHLQALRKAYSASLQKQIFEQYHFINKAGKEKSLYELFASAGFKNPPSGAGECAGPKLLQYAFQNKMRPLALAEFWWGQSPKSDNWEHSCFYPCCKEKCRPILAHMLEGINL